jgi:hypothetical protein
MISRSAAISAAKLAPREEHFRIPSHHDCLALFLRYLPPNRETEPSGTVVLYVHGGTFPSALSIAHRFAGRSSRDELCDAGFHVWGSISTASAGFPTPTQRWTSRPPVIRLSDPPKTPAGRSSMRFASSVRINACRGFRSSPTPGAALRRAGSPGAARSWWTGMGRGLSRPRSRKPKPIARVGEDAERAISRHLRRVGRRARL